MPGAELEASCRDRALVYGALSRLFRPQDAESFEILRQRAWPELEAALARLGAEDSVLDAAHALGALLREADAEPLARSYEATFEASGGLRCPPNEGAHTAQTPGEALTRTVELADVAGFYRAFGVEVEPGTERPDHVAIELEFMHLLAVKEAVARGEDADDERVAVCRDAARSFLRDHLGRWTSRLAERLEESAADPVYAAAGRLLDGVVAHDAASLGEG